MEVNLACPLLPFRRQDRNEKLVRERRRGGAGDVDVGRVHTDATRVWRRIAYASREGGVS